MTFWQAFLTALGGMLFGRIIYSFAQAVMGVAAMVFLSAFHSIVKLMPDEAWKMFEYITDVFYIQTDEWYEFVAAWLEHMTGTRITPEQISGFSTIDMGREIAEQLGETFLTPMLGLIMPESTELVTERGLDPQAGVDAAERFLATNMTFQMQAWLLHLLGDTISFGMWKSLKDLPNAINWSYGLGWLSWLVMGVPFRMGIADPLETLYNRMYRPWRPSFSYLARAWWREEISDEDYREYLRDMGVPERWIPVIWSLEHEPFSVTEIRDMYRYGYMDYNDLIMAYRHRGNRPEDAEALASLVHHRVIHDLQQDIAEVAVDLYIDGIMDWTEASGYLALAAYTTQEIETYKVLADLKKLKKVEAQPQARQLTAANIGQLYRQQIINRDEAEALLIALPFEPGQIALFLDLYKPKEPKVEEPPELTRAAIGMMWKRQQITDEEAEALWRELGYDDEAIYYWFKYYSPQVPYPPPPPAPPTLSVSRIGQVYREGGLTRDEALDRLKALGWSEQDAALLLDYIYAPPPPPVEEELRLPRDTIGRLYREGIITEGDAIGMWMDLGYSRDVAESLAALYAPPPEVPPPEVPPRELSTAQVGRLYQNNAISLEEAVERLTRLNWREEDARLLLETLYAPPPPPEEPVLRLPRDTIGGLFRRGIIDEATARAMWQELGFDAATTDLLVQYYLPPPEVPPPVVPPEEFTVSQVGQLYRAGGLTLEEAIERLERINWRREDAELLLTTLYAPPEPEVVEPRLLTKDTIGRLFNEGIIDEATARDLFAQAGYAEPAISWLIQLYAPPPEVVPTPPPPRELTTSQVGRLYQEGALSLEEAVERLKRINWREEDARLILEVLYPPPEPEVVEERLLTKGEIAQLYSQGIITEDAFRGMMLALGYSEESVDLLEQLYRPVTPAPPPPRELQPTTVGRLWQERTIDLREAVDRLERINIPRENALLYLTLYAWDPLLVQVGQALKAGEIDRRTAEIYLFDLGMSYENIQLWLELWS